MSNKQARAKKLTLARIVLTFTDGTATFLDPLKVQIVDRKTGQPIFMEKEIKSAERQNQDNNL